MPESLHAKIIRLAYQHPEFQAELLPLIKSGDTSAPSNGDGFDPKKPSIATKVGKLMPQQVAILQNYLRYIQQKGSRLVDDYESLPRDIQDALVRVKDQETLWSDVERWLGDNQQAPADRFDRWAKSARVLSKMESMRRMQELRSEHGNGSRAFYETVLQEVKDGIIAPAAVVGGGYTDGKAVAIKWLTDNMQKAKTASEKSAAWENLPKGWTQDSVQSMWDTMTDGVKKKITKCMQEMDGKVDNTGAFCGSLAAQVGYKRATNMVGDATILRRAMIRVANDDKALRTTLLPCITHRA